MIAFSVLGSVFLVAMPASAIPAFARKEGQSCGFCHTAYPKLNEAGRSYKQNGFRFPGEIGNNIWEEKSGVPLSVVAEIEALLNHTRPASGRTETDGPDGGIGEVELMGAGTLSNRASFKTEIEFQEESTPEVGAVWVQVNDLHGPQGAANLQLGQFEAGLPFFSQRRRVIRNDYLAFDSLGFLDSNFGAEINGQLFRDPDDEDGIVHRYGTGVFRGGTNDNDNKFTKGMGWYSLTFDQVNNIGIIATGGQDEADGNNFKTAGVAAVGQTEVGKWTLTGGYFFEYQNFNANSTVGGNQLFHNVMTEALYMPTEQWVLGARLDWLAETERDRNKDWGLRASALARYNVVSNVWLGCEYRIEDGGAGNKAFGSPVTNADTTQKGRLFAFFAY